MDTVLVPINASKLSYKYENGKYEIEINGKKLYGKGIVSVGVSGIAREEPTVVIECIMKYLTKEDKEILLSS